MQLALLVLVFLVLLWIVASVLRGKGVLVAGAGLLALAAALVAFARGRRDPLFRLFWLTALGAVTTLAAEALLWIAPGLLAGRFANAARGGYHAERDGIYRPDARLAFGMRPGFSREMYFNGHRWRHETNADGYRGPRLAAAWAVFLGDSLIYGHGVEERQTVPARYAELLDRPAANLGQQGTGLVQALELLRRVGLRLGPRRVFVCSHPNDPDDTLRWYAPDELERFLRTDGYAPLARREANVFGWWLFHATLPLRAGRVLQALLRSERPVLGLGTPSLAARFVPAAETVEARFGPAADARLQLGWRAHRRAVLEIAREARAAGAQVVLLDLGYPRAFSREVEQLAREAGAEYSDAGREVLARAQAGEDMYLARDGHWSPAGCSAIARRLASAR